MKKKIVFLTGTRADFGKLQPLIEKVDNSDLFQVHIFATGMHTLSKYGITYKEIEKKGFPNIYRFINQREASPLDITLANTILGFSHYIHELQPDLIIVHGDRVEALAGAIVGAFNKTLVAHIEGGEVSGTIDELIRHSITKLSHIHFVANQKAKNRVLQLGENSEKVFVIGSPEVDKMLSSSLPTLTKAKERYNINFNQYGIFIYHPGTMNQDNLKKKIRNVITALEKSENNYVVVRPNNDPGNEIINDAINNVKRRKNFEVFPSLRFEHFLTLLKNAQFIVGNSSSGIREAGVYGVPAINIGTRQEGRSNSDHIIQTSHQQNEILKAIDTAEGKELASNFEFGSGNSSEKLINILNSKNIWETSTQKHFIDLDDVGV